jgi:hypothetical protein
MASRRVYVGAGRGECRRAMIGHRAHEKGPEVLMNQKPRKRIWVQHVAVESDVLGARLEAVRAHGLPPDGVAVAEGVEDLISRARNAALREDPIPGHWLNLWRGTLVEAAYRNLHAARAQIVDLYDESELQAEVPSAVARAQATMHREDPRCIAAGDLNKLPFPLRRARLRRLIEDSYEATDLQHARLRSFRNIVLISALLMTLLVAATVWVVSVNPSVLPLCFPNEVSAGRAIVESGLNCPTRSDTTDPSGGDVLIVALLGLLGGALGATISVRNLRGTSTPYDVPVALAMLKVPLGAFTAILGLVAIRGDFIPGLSVLDSQEQILAYALVLGFAQQVFTRLLDRQAQSLLSDLPSRDSATAPQPATQPTATAPPAQAEASGQSRGTRTRLRTRLSRPFMGSP